jgi:ribonuclease P protein component
MRENKLPHSRFGVVVGLKVSKRSTDRNLIRRRIREILRKSLPFIKPGYDVMVLVNPAARGATFPDLVEQMDKVLRKADLIVQ